MSAEMSRASTNAGYASLLVLQCVLKSCHNDLLQAHCIDADLATRVDLQPSDPALTFYPYKQRPGLGGWMADDRAATSVAVSHDESRQLQVLEAFRRKDVGQQQKGKSGVCLAFDALL